MKLLKSYKNRIFCVSHQRNGTTSVGQFFKGFNYKVCDWDLSFKNNFAHLWELGDFEKIFSSRAFRNNQVFEDDPWWLPEFYKVLFHRFPNSKFILLYRHPDKWFKSMLSHSDGKILGNAKRHCKVYRRELDFKKLKLDEGFTSYDELKIDNLLSLRGYDQHYKSLYQTRNEEIIDFFEMHAPEALFHTNLEDPKLWVKLGAFFQIDVSDDFQVHVNKSKK